MTQPSALEMRLKQSQNLKQMQRLIMSPQMQQAISLLQMPLIELADRIDEEMVQNPILENAEEDQSENTDNEDQEEISDLDDNDEGEIQAESELSFDDTNFEILKRLDDDLRDHFDQGSTQFYQNNSEEEKQRAFRENSLCAHVGLFEHLMNQARETFTLDTELQMAEALIGNFDRSGYLHTPLSEIALLTGFSEGSLFSVLDKIKRFDPKGVGAASLQECLLIQLRGLGKEETLAFKIVLNNYDELLHNRIPQIQKALGCTAVAIARAIKQDISKLELHPGESFSDIPVQPIVPDVTIYQEGDKLLVAINDESMPPLKLNRRYMRYLEDPSIPRETKEFIKQKIVSARWFIRNIHQRNDTLEKIASALAKRQKEFFLSANGQLKPLTMKVLSEELQIHESTVARAVAGKYINTPRGLLPLRSFFTATYVTEAGVDISSKTVHETLLQLISNENKKHPLSDEQLSSALKAKGIQCARRTVAKYRAFFNIGNAHQRKQFI
jgi:RNA polymerase sigma-54 factor